MAQFSQRDLGEMNPHNSKSLPNTDVLSEIPLRHLKTVIITFDSFLQKKHSDHDFMVFMDH